MKQTKFLLSVLMAIVMMAMCPMKTWAVPVTDVASVTIGGVETKYSNFEDALTAAVNAGTATMKMLEDVDINSYFYVDKNGCDVTIDLNGHKIESSVEAPLIDLWNGSLTIIDSSTDKTGTIKSNNSFTINNSGSITIHGGNFISATSYALYSFFSNTNVYGGRFITQAEDNISAVWATSTVLPDGYSFYNAMTGRKVEFKDYTGVIDENYNFVKDVIVMKDDLEINGNEAFTCPVNVTPASVTFNRNIVKDGGKYSFIVPFDIPAAKASTLGKFYKFEKYENDVVYFTEETDVKANTAYFFDPAQSFDSFTLNDDVEIKATTSLPDAKNPTEIGLYGTYKDIQVPEGAFGYLYEDGSFVQAEESDNTLPAFRAYLWLGSAPTSAKVNAIFGFFDEEVTGVKSATSECLDLNAPMYNLSGQRVSSPQKGEVYILNGKKVMFK